MEEHERGYRFLKAILGKIYLWWYNPKIIGKENIPKKGQYYFVEIMCI